MSFIIFMYTSCAYIYATITFCNTSYIYNKQILLEKRIEKLENKLIYQNNIN